MSYKLTVDRKPRFLHVRVMGENSLQTVAAYFADVRAACEQYKQSKVLIEEHLKGPSLNTIEVFSLVAAETEKAWPTVQKIAFVDVNRSEHDASLMQFGENVAVNRGVNMRVFSNVEDAEAWLVAGLSRGRRKT